MMLHIDEDLADGGGEGQPYCSRPPHLRPGIIADRHHVHIAVAIDLHAAEEQGGEAAGEFEIDNVLKRRAIFCA